MSTKAAGRRLGVSNHGLVKDIIHRADRESPGTTRQQGLRVDDGGGGWEETYRLPSIARVSGPGGASRRSVDAFEEAQSVGVNCDCKDHLREPGRIRYVD
ncbi:hypothetical protein BaRGS_00000973 [Batillaria attramentaria]|uniref:Uncharacterized protein n=1 Tax=Batillaria attramentaria TaxID=370345 RepID=A0ABD0M9U4_9CAEN